MYLKCKLYRTEIESLIYSFNIYLSFKKKKKSVRKIKLLIFELLVLLVNDFTLLKNISKYLLSNKYEYTDF